MKARDIKVGGIYLTYVSGERVRVRVIHDRKKLQKWERGRYQVERVDNGKVLKKWRSAQALHPVESYREAWPSMTEKQESISPGGSMVAVEDLVPGDVFKVRMGPAAGKEFEVVEVIPLANDYFRVRIRAEGKAGYVTRPKGWEVETRR